MPYVRQDLQVGKQCPVLRKVLTKVLMKVLMRRKTCPSPKKNCARTCCGRTDAKTVLSCVMMSRNCGLTSWSCARTSFSRMNRNCCAKRMNVSCCVL
nr:hypothetical protein [uncultured bacterium]